MEAVHSSRWTEKNLGPACPARAAVALAAHSFVLSDSVRPAAAAICSMACLVIGDVSCFHATVEVCAVAVAGVAVAVAAVGAAVCLLSCLVVGDAVCCAVTVDCCAAAVVAVGDAFGAVLLVLEFLQQKGLVCVADRLLVAAVHQPIAAPSTVCTYQSTRPSVHGSPAVLGQSTGVRVCSITNIFCVKLTRQGTTGQDSQSAQDRQCSCDLHVTTKRLQAVPHC